MMSTENRVKSAADPYEQLLEGDETVEELDRKSSDRKSGKGKKHRWVIPSAVGAVVVVAAAAVFASMPRTAAAPEVSAVLVEKKDIHQITDTNGTVESNQLQVCASPVTASLAEALPELGKTVKKGDVVVLTVGVPSPASYPKQ